MKHFQYGPCKIKNNQQVQTALLLHLIILTPMRPTSWYYPVYLLSVTPVIYYMYM